MTADTENLDKLPGDADEAAEPADAPVESEDHKRAESRTFLCVVDDSEELTQALRFACRRAVRTDGRIALLYVIEPAEFQHWMFVGNLMQDERREDAEQMIQVISSVVQKRTGKMPVVFIREGDLKEELLELVHDPDAGISVLILGAATGTDGPGPLVTGLMKSVGTLHIPITIVPGNLSDEQIDAIT